MPTEIDAQGISEELGVSLNTTYKLLRRRKIPAYRVGTGWRSTVEALDEWRERQLTLSGILATDQFLSECSRDYLVAEREKLLEDLAESNGGLQDESIACLKGALSAVESNDPEFALRIAARAVAAIEVWGRE